jgi:RNA polymerase sigma-70 factor (ECF subfamily)
MASTRLHEHRTKRELLGMLINLEGRCGVCGGVVLSEREVVSAAVSADFNAFYRHEYPSIRALVWTLTGDLGVAEDLTQESFLRAHARWSDVSGYDEPGAWVRRVAINLATSVLRRRGREARALVRFRARERREWELPQDDREFWAAVRALPARQASVLALHYYEDLPISDIATVLGIAEGTVKAHLHKGRHNLARRLGIAGSTP